LVFKAVARFLANVAGPAGTVLVLDDLQWAGRDALDLLMSLIQAPSTAPIYAVGAYRDTEVQAADALSILLADLARARLAVHRTLAPLALEEARQLLDGLVGDLAVDSMALHRRVLQRAGGVPFFLVSCAQALRATALGDGTVPEECLDDVPWDVAQGIRQRMAALPEAAREVLGVAAVVGRQVPRAILTAVVAQPEGEVLAALEAACRARLLLEEGSDAYIFAHDVIREVIEADLSTGRRGVVHLRVAEVIEAGAGQPQVQTRSAEVLAYHFRHSDAPQRALPYLELAGDRAQAQYALAAAEGYYREMVALAHGLERAAEEARAREKLGAVLVSVARYDQALAELELAVKTYERVGEGPALYRATTQIGWIHFNRGTPQQGVTRVEPLLELGASAAIVGGKHQILPRDVALAWTSLGHLYWASGRYGDCLAATTCAADLARSADEKGVLAHALARQGAALLRLGQGEEGCRVLGEAVSLAEATGHLPGLITALRHLAVARLSAGDFAGSRSYSQRCIELSTRVGERTWLGLNTIGLGDAAFLVGNWTDAHASFTRGAEIIRFVGASLLAAHAPLCLGRLHLARGDWEEAARCLEDSLALAAAIPDPRVLRSAHALLAERELLEGRPAAARARLVPLLDGPGGEEMDAPWLRSMLAWASLALGELDLAADLVAQAITRLRAEHNRLHLVDALRVQALVAMEGGRWYEAQRVVEEAVALARQMHYPYAEARVLYVLGLLQTSQNRPAGAPPGLREAQEQIEAALSIFRRLGARKDLEEAEQALRAIHKQPQRITLALPQ
jgi:tetratricopeptide (TPR) repeat protein